MNVDYCFGRCHNSLKKNLVLNTLPKTHGSDYLPYLNAIGTTFEEKANLKATSIDGKP